MTLSINIRSLAAYAALLFSPALFGCPHLLMGTPKQSDMVACREGYAIGYNYKYKSAEWVAYRLEAQAEVRTRFM